MALLEWSQAVFFKILKNGYQKCYEHSEYPVGGKDFLGYLLLDQLCS